MSRLTAYFETLENSIGVLNGTIQKFLSKCDAYAITAPNSKERQLIFDQIATRMGLSSDVKREYCESYANIRQIEGLALRQLALSSLN